MQQWWLIFSQTSTKLEKEDNFSRLPCSSHITCLIAQLIGMCVLRSELESYSAYTNIYTYI